MIKLNRQFASIRHCNYNNDRITWIDSLKGIAILGVIMIHCGGSQLPDPLGIVGRFGGAGVELFFVISAFLSYQSLEKVSAKGKTSIVYGKWILRKVVSFIPVYYLSLLFSVIVVGGYPYWYGNEGVITLWNVMSHLTFTWSWVPHYCNSIIGGEWYLGTLIVFYMMGPILFKLINSFERSIVFFFSTTVACKYIIAFADNRIPDNTDSYIYEAYFGKFWIFAQLPVLALGICLFFILRLMKNYKIGEKKLLSRGLLLFSIIMLWGQMNHRNVIYDISENTLIAIWFTLLIISQNIYSSCLINNSFFAILGKYSCPIYLFHILIIYLYDMWMASTGYFALDWIIKYLIIIVVSILFAIFIDKYVDKPYRNLIEKYIK